MTPTPLRRAGPARVVPDVARRRRVAGRDGGRPVRVSPRPLSGGGLRAHPGRDAAWSFTAGSAAARGRPRRPGRRDRHGAGHALPARTRRRRAIRYLHRAGEIATRRSAAREAVGHLTRALDLLRTLPDSPRRAAAGDRAPDRARRARSWPSRAGARPRSSRSYARAQELVRADRAISPQLFPALWGLLLFRTSRGEIDVARDLGERLLALARRTRRPGVLDRGASRAVGDAASLAASWSRPGITPPRAVASTIPSATRRWPPSTATRPGGVRALHGAWALELLGESAAAARQSEDAMALARRLDHPFSEAHALALRSPRASARAATGGRPATGPRRPPSSLASGASSSCRPGRT